MAFTLSGQLRVKKAPVADRALMLFCLVARTWKPIQRRPHTHRIIPVVAGCYGLLARQKVPPLDPFPVFHKVRADKTVEYGCYHLGYGPGRTADKITPVDRIMQAAKRSNLRGGPGTDHEKVGLLEIGDRVRVTGEIRDWLRIKTPNGREAFVYAPLLTHATPVATKPLGGKWTVADNQACQIWFDQENVISATWSGRCVDGKAAGAGRSVLRLRGNPDGATFVGVMRGGKARGQGTYTLSNGDVFEGQWRNGKLVSTRTREKRATGTESQFQKITYAEGLRYEGQTRNGKWHGRRDPDLAERCICYEGDFVDGTRTGRGTYLHLGRWQP